MVRLVRCGHAGGMSVQVAGHVHAGRGGMGEYNSGRDLGRPLFCICLGFYLIAILRVPTMYMPRGSPCRLLPSRIRIP